MKNSKIVGIGHYVPTRVISNHDLEQWMDTSDEWIRERTGIETRRWIEKGETISGMAHKATIMALERAKMTAQDIDCIVFATVMSDHVFPGGGCMLQERMGLPGIPAIDIRNACSGFLYALAIADSFIKTGTYRNVLVVGSEVLSTSIDLSTHGRNTAIIFADGAGAVILTPTDDPKKGILTTHLHADGKHAQPLSGIAPSFPKTLEFDPEVPGHGIKINMDGRYVFKHAVIKFPAVIMEALEATGCTLDDVDLLIPHQANLRITQAVAKKLGLPPEKVISNIQKYGNTTAASISIAMSEAWEDGLIKEDTLVCLAAFGAGFTWASALVRF